jgi:predicted nucleotidyltransferase
MAIGLDAVEAAVMRCLLQTDTGITGRAAARIVRLSQSTVQRALTRLRQNGLVVATSVPPSLLYRANREHIAMPALSALLGLDAELRARMAEHVAAWRPAPVSVIVYGSVARGEARPGSDLDVLIVRADAVEPDEPAWQRDVTDLADRIGRWSGRPAGIVEMSRREAADGFAEGVAFLVDADRGGWLIAGSPLHSLSIAPS